MQNPTREAGLLLHPTSLPSRFGIGDLGPASDAFVDWAASAGIRLWQILPLVPPGAHDSPYAGLSAFAGNPLLVSPEWLVEEGLLPAAELEGAPAFDEGHVDFAAVRAFKDRVLRASFAHARSVGESVTGAVERFSTSAAHASWLADWALFAALRGAHGDAAWTDWEPELVAREEGALAGARREHADEIAFHVYAQFLFFRQWERVRRAANARGISILGDLPIYVALDSADVWAQRAALRRSTPSATPTTSPGVPPDYFSADGQLWGNPLYHWDVARRGVGFDWWIERVRANLRLADLVRLDHFRGFAGYWEVPAGAATAARAALGERARASCSSSRSAHALGDVPIVAEDLGEITQDVRHLRRDARPARHEGPAVRLRRRSTTSTSRTTTCRTPSSTPARTTTTRPRAGTARSPTGRRSASGTTSASTASIRRGSSSGRRTRPSRTARSSRCRTSSRSDPRRG